MRLSFTDVSTLTPRQSHSICRLHASTVEKKGGGIEHLRPPPPVARPRRAKRSMNHFISLARFICQ